MQVRYLISIRGLIAITVWGASFVATRMALETWHPFGLVALRLWMGAALLYLFTRACGTRLLPLKGDLPVCLLLGGVLAGHLLLQARGLQDTSAMNTGWIIAAMPVMIAIGAQLLGQQRLQAIGWLGVLVGVVGVVIVTAIKPEDFAHARRGDLLQMGSCVTWTVYTLVGSPVTARNGALRVTALAMAVAAAVSTVASIGQGLQLGPVTTRAVLSLLFLGVLCSGVAYYLWFAATNEKGPTRVAALLYLEPFVTLITAALLLQERITWNAIAGGLTVLFGVWLVSHGVERVSMPAKPTVPAEVG